MIDQTFCLVPNMHVYKTSRYQKSEKVGSRNCESQPDLLKELNWLTCWFSVQSLLAPCPGISFRWDQRRNLAPSFQTCKGSVVWDFLPLFFSNHSSRATNNQAEKVSRTFSFSRRNIFVWNVRNLRVRVVVDFAGTHVIREYLRKKGNISTKPFLPVHMDGGWAGTFFYQKRSKIPWHCPFKQKIPLFVLNYKDDKLTFWRPG